jgi:putative heme transporter
VLLVLAGVALAATTVLAFWPVTNPGVQDCGTPLWFAIDGDNVRLRASDPALTPELAPRVGQPTCRERTDDRLARVGVALVAGVTLGLAGAVLGLIDDRLALRRAPRFESLLRSRPDGESGRRWDRPVVPVADVGRRLPEVEGRDVVRLVGGGVGSAVVLLLVAGAGDVAEAVGAIRVLPLLGLAVLVPVGWALTAVERGAAHGASRPLAERAPAAVATSFVSPVLPEFGASGLDAHHEVELGTGRDRAVAEAGALVAVAGAVHLVLLVVVALLVAWRGIPDTPLPDRGVVVVVAAVGLALVGAATAPRRWRQLVVRPDASAVRLVRARTSNPAVLAALAATAAALALLPGVALWLATVATGTGLDVPVALGLGLLAVAAGVVLGPLPAGVGVVDAALALGLWRSGIAPADAVGAVVVLRVVHLWLPIVPGALAARRLRSGPGQSLSTRRALSRRNFGHTSSRNPTPGSSPMMRSRVRPIG